MSVLEKKVQTIWLITFGDLLTLLLCFFVATITLSRAGLSSFTEANRQERSKIEGLEAPPLNRHSAVPAEETGTLIANKKSEALPGLLEVAEGSKTFVELSLPEGLLTEGLLALLPGVEKSIRPYLERRFLKAVAADVEVCRSAMRNGEEASWLAGGERALLLNRQLIDLGFPVKAIRLRNVGPRCKALGPGLDGAEGNDPAVRVTLTFEK